MAASDFSDQDITDLQHSARVQDVFELEENGEIVDLIDLN